MLLKSSTVRKHVNKSHIHRLSMRCVTNFTIRSSLDSRRVVMGGFISTSSFWGNFTLPKELTVIALLVHFEVNRNRSSELVGARGYIRKAYGDCPSAHRSTKDVSS